jgi:hypothetical protein
VQCKLGVLGVPTVLAPLLTKLFNEEKHKQIKCSVGHARAGASCARLEHECPPITCTKGWSNAIDQRPLIVKEFEARGERRLKETCSPPPDTTLPLPASPDRIRYRETGLLRAAHSRRLKGRVGKENPNKHLAHKNPGVSTSIPGG